MVRDVGGETNRLMEHDFALLRVCEKTVRKDSALILLS